MECLDKYLEAISHVNKTNMLPPELTDNIELQGKSSAGSLYYPKSPRSVHASKYPPFLSGLAFTFLALSTFSNECRSIA